MYSTATYRTFFSVITSCSVGEASCASVGPSDRRGTESDTNPEGCSSYSSENRIHKSPLWEPWKNYRSIYFMWTTMTLWSNQKWDVILMYHICDTNQKCLKLNFIDQKLPINFMLRFKLVGNKIKIIFNMTRNNSYSNSNEIHISINPLLIWSTT